MIGYKVTNPDYTCKDFKYEIGQTYEMDGIISLCDRGFHFCSRLSDCFNFYSFNSNNHVLKVEALGEIKGDPEKDNKLCTNKIKILEEISWDEVLHIVNEGKDCTGLCNTGDWNTGDWNTGNWNTGDCNTGNRNTGNWNTGNCNTGNRNTGNCNTGDWNTGNCNTGDWNTGDWNTGNCNTGDWNLASFQTGCFNTKDAPLRFFDKDSDWTREKWFDSKQREMLLDIPKNVVEWIYGEDMSEEEKEKNPTYKTTGGYLKVLDESDSAQIWWDGLSENDRNIIRQLPNFDDDKFARILRIKL